ncbi:hypothetical protein QBC34DRAFT_464755 [Podospora aff. communis PSN243]|uniref:Nephrocystin 3-like N-terminal domain-containing protein n=1 Tax=Podospora aff. communis PSN243 TaxID=3040156 RepID=A0AAV9H3B1_9PEZI|nr:hypothetical protein QBC34DRAFT_464755 [Podospora aff. communis PSN243]
MSGLEVPASIIAVITAADLIITWTGPLISGIRDATRDMDLVQIEISYLRGLMDSLRALTAANKLGPACLDQLYGPCRRAGLIALMASHLDEMREQLQPEQTAVSLHFGGSLSTWEYAWQKATWPMKRDKAQRLLRDIQSLGQKITVLLQQDIKNDGHLSLSGIVDIQHRLAAISSHLGLSSNNQLRHWISPLKVPYWRAYEEAQSRVWPGSGAWLKSAPQYKEWTASSGGNTSLFCLSGPSGSGKTILVSTLVANLKKAKVDQRVLYFFFDIRDAGRNTVSSLYTTLVLQLLEILDDSRMQRVRDLGQQVGQAEGRQPSMAQRIELLIELICDAAKKWTPPKRHLSAEAVTNPAREMHRYEYQDLQGHPGVSLCGTIDGSPRTGCRQRTKLSLLHNQGVLSDIRAYTEGRVLEMGDRALTAMRKVPDELHGDLAQKVVHKIVRSCGGLWLQACSHVDTITRMRSITDIKHAIDRLHDKPESLYRQMLLKLAHDQPDLVKETEQHPAETKPACLGHRMLTLTCQAAYCLVVPEFVAMATIRLSATGALDTESTPWDVEDLLRLLGDFLQVDPLTKEVNIPYSSMEEFFQQGSSAMAEESQTNWWEISELESQKSLAEKCAWFLGATDFATPLSGRICAVGEENSFRKFPGGLGRQFNMKSDTLIPIILNRLDDYPGLEYCTINFPIHARRAAYLDYKKDRTLPWTRQTLLPLLDGWLTGDIEAKEGRLRSWQEVHAFYCCETLEDCACDRFTKRDRFFADLGISFLLGTSPDTCLWCAAALSSIPTAAVGGEDGDAAILCGGCREKNEVFSNTQSGRSTRKSVSPVVEMLSTIFEFLHEVNLFSEIRKADLVVRGLLCPVALRKGGKLVAGSTDGLGVGIRERRRKR